MFTFYRWIIIVPLIVCAVLFALAHRQTITFTYSPFAPPIDIPLYVLALGLFALGFVFGSITTWVAFGALRAEKRALKKSIKQMEKDLSAQNAALEKLKEDQDKPHDTTSQNLLRG